MRQSTAPLIPVEGKPLPSAVRRALNVLIHRGFDGSSLEAVELAPGFYSIRATVADFTVSYDVEDLNTGEDI